MASGKSIHMEDLPNDLRDNKIKIETNGDWKKQLTLWAEQKLDGGEIDILSDAVAQFESTLIEVAMRKSGGKRQQAAKLLGWGRNTLTRKIQELQMYEYSDGVAP